MRLLATLTAIVCLAAAPSLGRVADSTGLRKASPCSSNDFVL